MSASTMSKLMPFVQRGRSIMDRGGRPEFALLLIWPWLLLAVNPNWIYLNLSGMGDAWVYLGHFLNLRDYLTIYDEQLTYYNYYITRMSWVLPGFVAYHLLPPLAANLALRLGVFYLTTLSVYGTLALTVGRRPALLAALLLGGYSYFLLAAGWDYVDGAGLAYLALTLFLLTRAARHPRPRPTLALAGAAAAAMIAANLFTALFGVCFALVYFSRVRERSARAVVLDLASITAGATAILTAIGGITYALGGEFLFFMPSVRFAFAVNNLSSNPWVSIPADWPIAHSFLVWHWVLLAAALLALALPWMRVRLMEFSGALLLASVHITAVLLMLGMQLRAATPVLNHVSYVSYLLPTSFLCLGALVAPGLRQLNAAQFAALVGATGVLSLAGPLLRSCESISAQTAVLVGLAAGGIWLAVLLARPGRLWHTLALVPALTLAMPSAFSSFQIFTTCETVTTRPATSADTYLAVVDARDAIHELAPNRQIFLWYGEPGQPAYYGLVSMYVWAWNLVGLVGSEFPDARIIIGEPTIALLSQQPDALAQAERTLGQRGRAIELIGQRRIIRGTIWFDVYLLETRIVPRPVILGETIDLSNAGRDAERTLNYGWSWPEPYGIWTNGYAAEIVMRPPQTNGRDVTLTMDVIETIRAYNPDRSPLVVAVEVNGVFLDRWVFDEALPIGQRQATIPAALLAGDTTTRVVLRIDTPRRAASTSGIVDFRLLGIAVRSIRIEAAPR